MFRFHFCVVDGQSAVFSGKLSENSTGFIMKSEIKSGSARLNSPHGQLWNPGLCPVPRYRIPPEERWPRSCTKGLENSLVGQVDLTLEQIAFYHEHGFIHGPFRLFSEAEMHAVLLRLYAIEAQKKAQRGGEWGSRYHQPGDCVSDPFYCLMHELVTHPRVLHFVGQVLGSEELLVRNADLVVKEPIDRSSFGWHPDTYQDNGYFKEDITTAWIALTPAKNANGGLWLSDRSHMREESPAGVDEDFNQTALDLDVSVEAVYSPGEVSCHHGRTLHASGSNMSDMRRIGLAVRYFSPRVKKEVAGCGAAFLACGDARKLGGYSTRESFPTRWWPYRSPGPKSVGETGQIEPDACEVPR